MSALDDAKAASVLAKAALGHPLVTHVRTIFESRVKMIWMTRDPARATRFFESEPFERYWLTAKYAGVKKRPIWKTVLADCAAAVKANQKLLLHKKDKASKQPEYLAIAKALRMPDIETMLEQIDEAGDAYTEDFLISSLSSHVSVVHLKSIPSGINPDGSITFDTKASTHFVDHYLLKAIPWLLQIGLMVSVALKTKDSQVALLATFNVERVTPIIQRFNETDKSVS